MAKEIERKFLLKNNDWKKNATGTLYRQGYLSSGKEATVRVRIQGDKAVLTIKGPATGISRDEYEYQIPVKDARDLFNLCEQPIIEKTRYKVEINKQVWEIDVFEGENKGLILAEIELDSENQEIKYPGWIGEEVTGNPLYYNASLVKKPFAKW